MPKRAPVVDTIGVRPFGARVFPLWASELTLAQKMETLAETRKREIEVCLEAFRGELD